MPRISELTEGTALTGTEYVPAVQGGSTVKILVSRFATYVNSLFGTGVATFLTTPTSANLKAALTDETGSGSAVFATSPTLVTPVLGAATATSINALTVSNTGGGTLSVASGTTLTGNVSVTFGGVASSLTLQGTGTVVNRDSADTLTNKTFDTAGTGNSFSIAGVAVTANNGTGAVARTTSPVFVTPALGAATATTLNALTISNTGGGVLSIASGTTLTANVGVTFGGTASSLTIQGTGTVVNRDSTDTLTNKTFDTAGTGNVFKINGTTISANTGTGSNVLNTSPNLVGSSTNDAAAAGSIGETISQNVLTASGTALTTSTPANVATITLTAGDWDIEAQVYFSGGAATTVTGLRASISTTSNTESTASPNFTGSSFSGTTAFATFDVGFSIARTRVSLSGSQQYWLVANAAFGVSTCKSYGQLRARRVR